MFEKIRWFKKHKRNFNPSVTCNLENVHSMKVHIPNIVFEIILLLYKENFIITHVGMPRQNVPTSVCNPVTTP